MPTSAHIDVLIPTHQNRLGIADTIASLQKQTHTQFHAYVLDDGSDDGTYELAIKAAVGDARFSVVQQDHQGVVATLNTLAAQATAPVVALLAAGDTWAPQRLAWGLQDLDDDVDAVAAFCAHQVGSATAPAPSATSSAQNGSTKANAADASLMARLTLSNCLAASTAMIRTSALHQVQPFARALETAHAWDLWLRLSLVGTLRMRQDVGATLNVAANAPGSSSAGLPRTLLVRAALEQMRVLEEMAPKMIAHHKLPHSTWGQVHGNMAMHAMTLGDAERALVHLATKSKHDGLVEHEQMWMLRCFVATNRHSPARDLANVLYSGRARLSEQSKDELTALAAASGWSFGPSPTETAWPRPRLGSQPHAESAATLYQ